MQLLEKLRNPVLLDENTNLEQACERISAEEHHVVFVHVQDHFYLVKSSSLLVLVKDWEKENFTLPQLIANAAPLAVLPYEELKGRALDVFAEEVSLIRFENELKYITREDFLLSMIAEGDQSEIGWLSSLFSSIPRGLMIVDLDYAVLNINAEAVRMLRTSPEKIRKFKMNEWFPVHYFQQVRLNQTPLLNNVITLADSQAAVLVDFVPLIENKAMTGYALVLQDLPSVESMAMELDSVKGLNEDLQAILSTIYDEIIVVDAKGTLLRASAHYLPAHWEQPPHELIGQQILQVKASEDLICQVIRKVQKSKRKVSLMQNSGDTPLLSVGNPILTKHGKLDRILIASRDLTEVSRLQRELEWTRKQSESYKRKLEELQERVPYTQESGPVYASPRMHEVLKEVERIAQFSATVLLTGESGVGKEVIANTIHTLSARREHPLIKINCASIPESLLESELFGYVKGAFSGAKSEGKIGLFVKADKGTLFLDEISELPLNIQSKLLRAIQEREVYPVGATEPVRFDIQLIAATNRPLDELVQQGEFREDLYYRINVFPIQIPPLRERKEDIAVLANHILFEFNQTYNRNLRFSSAAIEVLEAYSFPGNVRELQNVVQRIAIKNDGDIIDPFVVERVLVNDVRKAPKNNRMFTEPVPLKAAMEQIEEELIVLAMEKYGSTVKAAQVLGISQSSVSRKYQRYQQKSRGDAQTARSRSTL